MNYPQLSALAFAMAFVLGNAAGTAASAAAAPQDLPGGIPQPCASDQWIKRGVLLEGDGYGFQNFNSPAEPLSDGRWRIWYGNWLPTPNIGVAEGVPGGQMVKHDAVLSAGEPADAPLAIGNLPEGWGPVQPVHIKLKDGRHRLYFWVHSSKQRIVRFLAADSTDGRRYRVIDPHKAILYHAHDRAVEFVGTTPTGLKLEAKSAEVIQRFPRPAHEPKAPPELVANDSVTVYQLEDGTFEMYLSGLVTLAKDDPRLATQQNDNLKGSIRAVDRMVSADGLNWHDRRRVIEPDADDPIDQQFYYLNVTHTPQGRVGMLGHYRIYAQTMDVEWCYSKDGINWTRPHRKPWIKRGEPYESGDSYSIYPATSLVHHDGMWWLFYTGTNYAHNVKCSHGKPQSTLMFAQTKSIWQSEPESTSR
jgi:hypothetical protein